MALTNLGAIALDRGDLAEAEVFSRRSQSGSQDTGDKLMLSVSVGNLGHVSLARGERAAALRLYRDTAALTRESGYYYMLIEAVMGLAALAADLDPAAGAHWLAAVDAWRSSSGFLMQTLFVERLHRETETRLRAALGDRFDALWAEGTALPLETAADEAAAWASGEGMVMEGR